MKKKLPSITCACGQTIKYEPEEAGTPRSCPSCSRYNLIPSKEKQNNEDYIMARCPHCAKVVNKMSGYCPFCQKNLSLTPLRIVVFIIATVIASIMLFMAYSGATKPTKEDIFLRTVRLYHDSYLSGHWNEIFALFDDTNKNLSYNEFSNLMKTKLESAKITKIDIVNWEWIEKNSKATVHSRITATSLGQNESVSENINEEWSSESGGWKIINGDQFLLAIDNISQSLATKEYAPELQEVLCPRCGGDGKVRCSSCLGRGTLRGGGLCRMCYHSQGWNLCTQCRGTGIILQDN